jgi:hypothetical protein
MEHGNGFAFRLVPDPDGFRRGIQFDRTAFFLEVVVSFVGEFHVSLLAAADSSQPSNETTFWLAIPKKLN